MFVHRYFGKHNGYVKLTRISEMLIERNPVFPENLEHSYHQKHICNTLHFLEKLKFAPIKSINFFQNKNSKGVILLKVKIIWNTIFQIILYYFFNKLFTVFLTDQ